MPTPARSSPRVEESALRGDGRDFWAKASADWSREGRAAADDALNVAAAESTKSAPL
jgi:hypothetical protein